MLCKYLCTNYLGEIFEKVQFVPFSLLSCRAVENAESARSVIYAIFSAHSAYFNVSRQKVPYFNVSRQNRVVFKTVLQQNNVEAC